MPLRTPKSAKRIPRERTNSTRSAPSETALDDVSIVNVAGIRVRPNAGFQDTITEVPSVPEPAIESEQEPPQDTAKPPKETAAPGGQSEQEPSTSGNQAEKSITINKEAYGQDPVVAEAPSVPEQPAIESEQEPPEGTAKPPKDTTAPNEQTIEKPSTSSNQIERGIVTDKDSCEPDTAVAEPANESEQGLPKDTAAPGSPPEEEPPVSSAQTDRSVTTDKDSCEPDASSPERDRGDETAPETPTDTGSIGQAGESCPASEDSDSHPAPGSPGYRVYLSRHKETVSTGHRTTAPVEGVISSPVRLARCTGNVSDSATPTLRVTLSLTGNS